VFTEQQLLALQPVHVQQFFNLLAYGKTHPTPDDRPTLCRHSTLDQYKKAISYFHPNQLNPWTVGPNVGNPTRSRPVNDVIKGMKQAEVRNQGKASCAKRDLKRPEFRKTMRILERDGGGNIDLTMKAPTMMKTQFHLIGCTDEITNMETQYLCSHNKFKDFALQTKVSWSKNVLEERECPDQIMLACADPDFCIQLALACWIETQLKENHGDAKYLFGHHNDEDEPDRMNVWYGRTLKNAWKDPEFQELMRTFKGSLGTHSLRKFPATWATENGCNQTQVETCGRWKGKKNGHIVNVYISVEQLPTDGKVACGWTNQVPA
jgi:hypothetical protein